MKQVDKERDEQTAGSPTIGKPMESQQRFLDQTVQGEGEPPS